MALDFPNSPIVGQEFSASGKTWRWNGSKWISSTSALQLTTLNDVGDVTITAVSNGQVIKWNGSAWVNAADNAGTTISSIDDINDVTITSVATGQFLKWDGTAWVNDAIDLGTDTTGNYVSDITQGTGVTVTHTPGEGSSPTVAIGQAVGTSASVTFAHVSAPVTGNVTGNVTGSSGSTTGNAATATALQNARTISLSGDVSGSVSFDGTSNVSISATVEPNSVALGTDTTGNYVNDLTAGTGITVTHTPGEGSSPTVAIGQSVATSASVTFAKLDTTGDITVGGNLTVNGTTTTLNTETLAIEDNIVVLNSGVTGSPTVNAGIEVERGTSANVDLRWNESTDKWEFTNDGSTYSNLGAGGATISDTPPSSPVTGQIWYESDTGKTFVYYDSFWIEIVGSTGAQGPTGAEGGTTTLTTKGDLLTRSASAVARLPVGATNGHVLTVDSAEASGMKWAASGGGGSSEDSISPFLLMGA
jgi:hypothetical protein